MLSQQRFQSSHFPHGLILDVAVQVRVEGVCVFVPDASGVEHDLRAPPMVSNVHTVQTQARKYYYYY